MSGLGSEALPNPVGPAGSGMTVPRLRWRWKPADTVVAIATTLIVIIFAVFGFLCVQGYSTTIDGAKARAQTAADVVSDDIDWTISSGLSGLKFVAAAAGNNPAALTADEIAPLDAALKTLPADTRSSVALYDATGAVIAPAAPPSLPASLAGTDAFAALQQGSDWVILPQGKDGVTGDATMLIAKRLGGANFAGVALLALPGDLLQSFWAPQNLGADSTVNVHREDGEMVGRYPPLAEPQSAKNSPNWPLIAAAENGTYTTKSPIDGVTRVVGFRHIRDLGLVVFATVSQDAALASLWTSIITVLWLMVPIALALLVGSLITAAILRRSERTQASLAAAVAHNEVLFREIHHRVKNNLQSVASLLQMQPIPKDIKANMGQRIAAMSAVHEHIYRSNDFATVHVKSYLETLIESIRAGQDPNVRVIEQIDDLAVDKDAATPLGLILNEVVANAFKHAFADGRQGMISARLRKDEAGRGRLVVEDNGVGFDPSQPAKGIGRRLISALTMQLGGEAEFSAAEDGGSRFTLSFPLAKTA